MNTDSIIEIPYSGGDLFVEIFKETNRDLKLDDDLLDKAIQYYNCAIIKIHITVCFNLQEWNAT